MYNSAKKLHIANYMEVNIIKYVFINPVVDKIYSKYDLDCLLSNNGITRIYVNEDWYNIVKQKYMDLNNKNSDGVILDKRCPLAIEKIQTYLDYDYIIQHNIHPILIHCGIEISKRDDIKEYEKIITTPCKSLADYGNSLNLLNTTFLPWKVFLNSLEKNFEMDYKKQEQSPIPLGYFSNFDCSISSLSGGYEIENYFKNEYYKNDRIVEMLYCDNGCINGDGV